MDVVGKSHVSVGRWFVMIFCAVFLCVNSIYADEYVIGGGDRVQIFVWGEPDLSVITLVRPDGYISVPGGGEILAEGLTPVALQDKIAAKLASLVKSPQVTVSMAEIFNSKVYIIGGGVPSGVVDLKQRTTLLQLLASIDLSRADLSGAYVMRGTERLVSDFSQLLHKGDLNQNIVLRHNDVMFFPAQPEPFVYVMGAVNNPKSLAYKEGMSIVDALLECGGFNKFASKNNTVIVRRTEKGEERIKVRAKDLVEGKDLSNNVILQRGDYIIVNEGMF